MPSFVAATTAQLTTSGSKSVPIPGGASAGHYLLCQVVGVNHVISSLHASLGTIAGYQETENSADAGANTVFGGYYDGSTTPTYTITLDSEFSRQANIGVIAISGAGAIDEVFSLNTLESITTINLAPCGPSMDGCLIVCCLGASAQVSTLTFTAPLVERVDAEYYGLNGIGTYEQTTAAIFVGEAVCSVPTQPARTTVVFAPSSSTPGTRYQRLYGPAQLETTAANLYTVPPGLQVEIRRIWINNPSGSTIKPTLSIGADAASTRYLDLQDIVAGGSYDGRRAMNHTLVAGESIQGKCDTAATQTSFPVTAGGDDGRTSRTSTTWPPVSGDTSNLLTTDQWSQTYNYFVTPNYTISQTLMRWDTSSLPDDAIITGATLSIENGGPISPTTGTLKGDWYVATSALSTADWINVASAPYDAFDITLASVDTPGIKNITLSNYASNVNKTGYTGIRMHYVMTTPPPTDSSTDVFFAMFDHASMQAPTLVVDYTTTTSAAVITIDGYVRAV